MEVRCGMRYQTPPRRRGRRTAAGLLLALAVAGCGGHTATKSDVIARGNAICAAAVRELRATAPPAPGSLPALSRYLQQLLPIVRREVSDLKGLPRPAQDRALLDRYVSGVTKLGSTYADLAAAAERGDQEGVDQALAALQANSASALAGRYGLRQCASAATTSVPR